MFLSKTVADKISYKIIPISAAGVNILWSNFNFFVHVIFVWNLLEAVVRIWGDMYPLVKYLPQNLSPLLYCYGLAPNPNRQMKEYGSPLI